MNSTPTRWNDRQTTLQLRIERADGRSNKNVSGSDTVSPGGATSRHAPYEEISRTTQLADLFNPYTISADSLLGSRGERLLSMDVTLKRPFGSSLTGRIEPRWMTIVLSTL